MIDLESDDDPADHQANGDPRRVGHQRPTFKERPIRLEAVDVACLPNEERRTRDGCGVRS